MAPGKSSATGKGKEKKSKKVRLHLRHGKPLGQELRKIALLQIEGALEALHGNNVMPDSVHDARTYIKKLRAILHLASPVMSKKQREQAILHLRESSMRLGPLRDSEVRVRTLDSLLEQTGLPINNYASLRAGLEDVAKQRRKNDARRIPGVLSSLKELRDSLESWPLEKLEGRDLKRRLRRSYRRGRMALELCSATPAADHFHFWRKQVKQLWYQLRITAHYWKDEATDLIATTGRIGQLAGDERDLTLLGETLRQGPQGSATAQLQARIASLLPSLRHEAMAEGLAFYETRPKQFVENLEF
jgi:CHAD domain-containing protein